MRRKKIFKKILWLLCFLLCFSCILPLFNGIQAKGEELNSSFNFEEYINTIFSERNKKFLAGDVKDLFKFYDTSTNGGKYSLNHEIKRIYYLRDWALERGIKFTSITSNNTFKKISTSGNHAKIRVDEEYKFDYIYEGDSNPTVNSFGITLFHIINLSNKNNNWIISQDWYLDCFEDGLKKYQLDLNNLGNYTPKEKTFNFLNFNTLPNQIELLDNYENKNYNRKKAVEYADKYCGVIWGSNNPTKYNKKYKNYTGGGGNCTNYISQCLGDTEGGNLKQGHGWYCVYKNGFCTDSSPSWVNADAFKNFLLYSGKGKIIKAASFKDLLSPLDDSPQGYIGKIKLGDVISYGKGLYDIDHSAIVTSFDSHGYPLINSHTVDRYHVPFDLGWSDNNIVFYLISIN